MNNKDLGTVVNDVIISLNKHLIWISITALLLFLYVLPPITLLILVDEEERMQKDIGYVRSSDYDKYLIENNDTITNFDIEVNMSRSFVEVNNHWEYRAILTSSEIFDIGMMDTFFWNQEVNLYAFDFIYGEPFDEPNEIVISESISTTVFNKINTVGEYMDINGVPFVVVGVIDSHENVTESIYLSNKNIELIINEEDQIINLGYLIKDKNLHYKLYQKGGYNLVDNTVTYLDQGNAPDFILVVRTILIVILLMSSIVTADRRKKVPIDKNKDLMSYRIQGAKKYMIKSFSGMTVFMGLFILYYIISLSETTTLKVSTLVVIEFLIKYPIFLLLYFLIIVDIFIKERKLKKQKQMIES